MKDDAKQPIDHARVTDGFDQLRGFGEYVPFATYCGICDNPIVLSPRAQKYLLEIRSVPVKMLQRGAAYCTPCAKRRARLNYLAQSDRWREEPDGQAELERLREEEGVQQLHSRERYRHAQWPYGAG